ncbi:MAG TPA: hypothetical protein VF199_06480 [Bacillales bacterium]
MNSQETRYRDLVLEFEDKLGRELELKEMEFIKWIAEHEEGDLLEPEINLVNL